MRQLAWAFITMCVASVAFAADPVYQAGQPATSVRSWLHGEISADYQFSSQRMKTNETDAQTSALNGWNVRALWAPISWLAIGAEYAQFGDEKLKEAYVSSYETSRLTGLVKLTLSPNTSPRVYVLAGYGRTNHQLNYDHAGNPIVLHTWPAHDKKAIAFWMLGIGLEANVWRALFVGVEGNILRHQTAKLPRFYKADAKMETVLKARVGVRF
jgi:opacity protein-like surface antigen